MVRLHILALSFALSSVIAGGGIGPAQAETSGLVNGLRREPVSLFDWGLHLLEEELQGVRRHDKDFLRVFYDPELDRIMVDAVFYVDPAEIAAIKARSACYTRLHAIKLMFGVIDTDMIHIAPAAEFRLGMKFSHHDSDAFPELPNAEKIGAELLDVVYIQTGIVSDLEHFPFRQDMRCAGELTSQTVHYGADGARFYHPD